jgi:hypothetical protein
MKKKLTTLFKMAVMLIGLVTFLANKPSNNHGNAQAILMAHKWTAIEEIQTKDGISLDILSLRANCETDDYTEFLQDGKYQILYGTAKCKVGESDVKAEGEWALDEKNGVLTDRFSGGAKVEKKIISLTDDKLQVSYIGEEGRACTTTYISEQAQQQPAYQKINVPESRMGKQITSLIHGYVESTGHYNVITEKDVENGKSIWIEETDRQRTTFLLWPLNDRTDTTSTDNRKANLLALAKQKGIRYVLTGRVTELKTYKEKESTIGSLRVQLMLLDTASATIQPMMISGDSRPIAQQKTKGVKLPGIFSKATEALGTLAKISGIGGILFQEQKLLTAFWKLSLSSEMLADKSNTANMFFSDIPKEERKTILDSTTAVKTALGNISDKVEEFVSDQLAYLIPIKGVEGDGKKAKLLIAAGSNIRLKPNENLLLVQLLNPIQPNMGYSIIGTMKVESISDGVDNLSFCVDNDKKANPVKTFEGATNKETFFVKTMRQQPSDND